MELRPQRTKRALHKTDPRNKGSKNFSIQTLYIRQPSGRVPKSFQALKSQAIGHAEE